MLLKMSQKVPKSLLASRVVIYSHVQLHQQSTVPITHNQGTHACLTWLANQPQQKQTEQFLALMHTCIDMAIEW